MAFLAKMIVFVYQFSFLQVLLLLDKANNTTIDYWPPKQSENSENSDKSQTRKSNNHQPLPPDFESSNLKKFFILRDGRWVCLMGKLPKPSSYIDKIQCLFETLFLNIYAYQ